MNSTKQKAALIFFSALIIGLPLSIFTISWLVANWSQLPRIGEYLAYGLVALLTGFILYHTAKLFYDIQLKKAQVKKLAGEARNERKMVDTQTRKIDTELYLAQRQQAVELSLKQERHTAEIQLLYAEFALKQHLALTRVQPETYLLNLDEHTTITPFHSLKPPREDKTGNILLDSPHQPPSEEYLLSQIKENSFTVSPGIRASNGEPVLIDITQVPHGKLIGSSGFGKSTAMYIMLKQATETNHPKRLQLALLDLEHKTSRLLEDKPHVACLRVGKRLVQMVATTADQVAEYLGYLKLELDRRAKLSEAELCRQPALIIYVEEMLSLQYEVMDPKLLRIIFHSLTILSVRGKKYGMFLYACMQTDYSTDELKVSQKMFRFRGAASVDPSAARAAGFINTDLIKHNFQHGKPGQLVVEFPSFSDLVLVPPLEIKREIAKKTGFSSSFGEEKDTEHLETTMAMQHTSNAAATPLQSEETTPQARLQAVRALWRNKWGKVAIIEKVWQVKPGSSKAYKQAASEYEQIVTQLEAEQIGA